MAKKQRRRTTVPKNAPVPEPSKNGQEGGPVTDTLEQEDLSDWMVHKLQAEAAMKVAQKAVEEANHFGLELQQYQNQTLKMLRRQYGIKEVAVDWDKNPPVIQLPPGYGEEDDPPQESDTQGEEAPPEEEVTRGEAEAKEAVGSSEKT